MSTIARDIAMHERERATWLRVAEVARFLGMSANTVRRWTDAGRIPAHRSPGGHRRYLLDEILALPPELGPGVKRPVRTAPAAAVEAALDAGLQGPLPAAREAAAPDAGAPGVGMDAAVVAELATVLRDAPEELPERAARALRDLADAGRCEVLMFGDDVAEVVASVDAGVGATMRVGQRYPLADRVPPAWAARPRSVATRRRAAGTAEARALRQRGAHALLWTPLVGGGRLEGALELTDTRDRDLRSFEPSARAVAHLVAHAMDFSRTRAALDERRRTMRELLALSQEAARATDLESFGHAVAERVITATNADYVDLWQAREGELRAIVRMSREEADEQHRGGADVGTRPRSAAALAGHGPLVVCSLRDERLSPEEVGRYRARGYESSLSVPIVAGGEMVGLLELYDDAERDWSKEVDFVTNVSQHLAGILVNTVLLDEVQRKAVYERELVALAEELSRTPEPRQLAVTAAATLRRVLDVEDCDIWHLDEGRLRCLISVDRAGVDTAVEGKLLDLHLFPSTAAVLEGRESMMFADLDDPRLSAGEIEDWAEYGFRSGMTLPLIAGDDVIGMIDVFDTRERDYTETREFVFSAGRMVADGLKNAQLLASLQQSNRGLKELLKLDDVIAGADDPGKLARTVAGRLRDILHAEDCDIWRIDGEHLRCLASIDSNGWDEDEIGQTREVAAYPETVAAIARNEPIVLGDLDADSVRLPSAERRQYVRWGYRSMVSLPLVQDGRPVGLVDIFDTRPRDWTGLMDFIRNVGTMLAGAFDKAVLLDELARSNSDLRLLAQSSLDFGATLDPDSVVRTVAQRILEVSGADLCDIFVIIGDDVEVIYSADELDAVGKRYGISDSSVLTEALTTRAAAVREDVRTDPRSTPQDRADAERWDYRARTEVPLIVRGEVTGFASLCGREPGRFSKMDTVVGLAQIAAQAIANAKLFRQLDENAHRLGQLSESTLELTSTLDLEDVLTRLAWRLCHSMDVPDCEIHVVEGADRVSVMSLTDGVVDHGRMGFRLPLGEAGVTREVMRTKRPAVVRSLDDPRLSERVRALHRGESGGGAPRHRCWVTLPLIAGDEVIGIAELVETRVPRDFTTEEIEAAAAICHAAAMALTNARLFACERAAHREMSILNEIARATAASLDIGDIAAAAARQLEQVVELDAGCALLLFAAGRVTRVVTAAGEAHPLEAGDFPMVDGALAERLLTERLVVLRLPEESPLPPGHPTMAGVRSMAVLALGTETELVGALAMASRRADAYADLDTGFVAHVSTQLSLAVSNARLYEEVKEMHLGNLKALSSALNAKDYYTLGHAARVAAYMVMLGEELGWGKTLLGSVEEAAYLHDIGKISISDRVLLKPGRLNDREWEQMRQHPVFSADIIRPLFSEELVLAVRHHHEKYGGGGYPDGLAGEEIPPLARAMAVVDAYDAMSCRRPYKAALTYPECLEELERCRGSQFDPLVVDAFLRVLERVFERRATATRIASQAADLIPGEWHAVLRGPEDESREEYRRITEVLRQVRDANPPTRFLTTHCRLDHRYVIGVDPEEDEAERSRFGDQMFPDDELMFVLDGRIPDVNILFADEFGVWVTGLSPIHDDKGAVVAAVLADLPAIESPAGAALASSGSRALSSMLQTAAVRLSRDEIDAITDGLTGLYNHGYLHERLSEEIERAREHGQPLSVLFCDLDNFKEYNARCGHSAGDAALREVAHVIEQSVRTIDMAARYGGEEFVVVLVETPRPGAVAVAERIRGRLESNSLGADGARLTVSVGVAAFPEDAAKREELLDKADWAMCLAKRQGRNRVVSFSLGGAAS